MTVPNEVSKIINDSGNTFHASVARWLYDQKWHVVVSPYYMDHTHNKAREIDLVAEKLWPIKDRQGQHIDNVAVRLFIECKYFSSHSVLWFAEKDLKSAKELVCSNGNYRSNNMYTDEHHYLTQSHKVAKIFSTRPNKSPENDPFYKALNQVLNAMVSMRRKAVTVPREKKSYVKTSIIIEFPVVVCSSFNQTYKVDFYTESDPELIKDNFQLEIRYAYFERSNRKRDDYFLIDFVEFDQIDKFTDAISNDANIAVNLASIY